MTPEIKAKLFSTPTAAKQSLLPPAAFETIAEIRTTVEGAIAALPPGAPDELKYTLEQIRTHYVPDAVDAYIEAQAADPALHFCVASGLAHRMRWWAAMQRLL